MWMWGFETDLSHAQRIAALVIFYGAILSVTWALWPTPMAQHAAPVVPELRCQVGVVFFKTEDDSGTIVRCVDTLDGGL